MPSGGFDPQPEDDAFFAQLREAVSDETPPSEGETSFFDQDLDSERPRDLFRRRR